MSYYTIDSYGRNPKEALNFCKLNEIGHKTKFTNKNNLLLKTDVYQIDLSRCIEYRLFPRKLFTYYNCYNLTRDKTKTEIDTINLLDSSLKDLTKIIQIYDNSNNPLCICFKIGTLENGFNRYRFMY